MEILEINIVLISTNTFRSSHPAENILTNFQISGSLLHEFAFSPF